MFSMCSHFVIVIDYNLVYLDLELGHSMNATQEGFINT